MTRDYLRYLFALGAVAAAASAQTLTAPPVPAKIQVPAGNVAFLKGSAVGTQNYVCLPSGDGLAWKFQGPQATVFVNIRWINGDIRQQIMTHFLSPNPAEAGAPARATWQSSLDTSAVWARAIASSNDPNFVAPGAIPWLLLEVVGSNRGPEGGSSLIPTTFIHRLNTSGGVALSTGCSEAANMGKTAFVPYTTDYIFYKSSR